MRLWHYLHLDIGLEAGGVEQIASLPEELVEIEDDVIGIILMGDSNVHHRK